PRIGILGQVLIVGGHRARPVAFACEPVGGGQERGAARERQRRAAGEAHRQQDGREHTPHAAGASLGSSTVKRLPLPSCDSTVTPPRWAWTSPRTIDRPSPVPPLPRC